jgi:class 3 adenylate cyclase
MSDNKQITDKIELPKFRLWLIWFMLFVFPSIAAIVGFKSFSNKYSFFGQTDLISNSFERIKEYDRKIVPETFLENQLKIIRNFDTNQSAQFLKENIDKTLCGETLLCFFFNKYGNKTINIKSQKLDKIIKNFPNAFIKKHINLILEAKNSNESTKTKKIKDAITKFGNTLQQLFKTITPITISENKISKNYSIMSQGELYFIFCLFDNPSKDYQGFLAVMRGKEFSFHKMLELLHHSYPEIRIIFRDIDVEKTYNNPEKIHSGIKQTRNGLYIISPTNLFFARHVVYGGSDEIISQYGNLLPFIEYRIPTENINNFIDNINKYINYIALFIILLSGIFFLHVCLFGFSDNISFKNKIMFLAFTSAIFPFSVFTLGIYGIENYNNFIEKTSIQQHAETELHLASQELEQYKTEIETKVYEYGNNISNLLTNKDLKPSTLLDYLKEVGDIIPASIEIIYIEKIPPNLEIICNKNKIVKKFPDRMSNTILNEEGDSITNLLPHTLMKALTDKESKKKKETINKLEVGNQNYTSSYINECLQNNGKLTKLDQFRNPTWYIFQQLNDSKTLDNSVIGIFVVRFEPRPLLGFFFSNCILQKRKFKEIKGNYQINYAFLPIEKSGTASIWSGSGNISEDDKALCLKEIQTGIINLKNKIIIKKKNNLFPHLGIAIITPIGNTNINSFFIYLLISVFIYLSLILYFASKLLDIMIMEPVMTLATNANAIARGSDKWNAEINSGDEFEDLNNDFKYLVTGLQERNILKSYVSEDAFSDIEGTDSLKLLPGGEYLEATIVFSAIKDYEKLSASITPQESIKLLSNFMSIAEEVTKKYGGSIDKIIGDTIMLVFRENHLKDSHGLRAAKASLELVEKAKFNKFPKLYTGIASGRVISGRIGSYSGKLDFTVIGNPVNLAARFKTESKNGTENTGIIISGITIGLMNGKANVRFLRRVSIKGKARKYNIYELLSIRN